MYNNAIKWLTTTKQQYSNLYIHCSKKKLYPEQNSPFSFHENGAISKMSSIYLNIPIQRNDEMTFNLDDTNYT